MTLTIETNDRIGWITLDRAEKKNSFTMPMLKRWTQALREFEADDDIRVVVVRGSGDSFCAGADLGEISPEERTPLRSRRLMTDDVHHVARAVDDLTKPLIAGVNGVAVGAGLDMALMCDYRIAARRARMSEGYIRVGLVPGDGGCFFLPRLIGSSQALRLLWTGEFVDADRAEALGMVDEVCEDDAFEERLGAFARQLAAQPPVAVQLIKQAVRQSHTGDLRGALDLIASHQAVAMSTDDSQEAMAAFRERRRPNFHGR
ncbi:enoyl-CoA hydratase/isomerase family protein [Tomitella gaofuii]|uniref:enoyl-CoA hydratase/isomerase family protein n=1 Tax=Tomitella gaofuii TaxID=2760083 RepID=UPI0015F9E1EB|nr:enoyl-CoA hydratase/isomerase family protein [Tomitella gaofuii]